MRPALLARVSSDGQDVAPQIAEMRAAIARDGRTLDERHVYVDVGVSGRTGNLGARRDLLRMIRDLGEQPRPWDVLYFFDFDRMARSEDIEEQARILGPLQRAAVGLVTRNGEQPPLSTFLGRMWAHFQLEGAADWLVKHKDRLRIARARTLAAGGKPAGPTPYGLTYDRATKTWGIDEPVAELLRELRRRVATGESCERIYRDLEARQVLSSHPSRRGKRNPRGWSRERVYALVTSRTYVGEWLANKKQKLVVKVPAIFTEAEWQEAQEALAAWGRRGPTKKHPHLVGGIAVCGVPGCGVPMHVAWASPWKAKVVYYVCKQRRRARWGTTPCTLPMRRVEEVDARVWRAMCDLLERPDLLEQAMASRSEAGRARDFGAELRQLEAKLRRSRTTEDALLERFQAGMISAEAMDRALARGKSDRAELERQLQAVRAAAAGAEQQRHQAAAVLATAATFRSRLADATREQRRELARMLIPAGGVVIGREEVQVTFVLRQAAAPLAAAGCSSTAECKEEFRVVVSA